MALGHITTIAAHKTAGFDSAAYKPCAVAYGDAAEQIVFTYEPPHKLISTDFTGAITVGYTAEQIVFTYEPPYVLISIDCTGAIARSDTAAISANKAADMPSSTDCAGAITVDYIAVIYH